MSQWYITKYSRLVNGTVEIISYTKAANFAVACGAERINLPKPQFYHAENCVGSLLPKLQLDWIEREQYAHKKDKAEMQIGAELVAKRIIKSKDVNFANITKAMKDLKPLLTKAQYDLVFKALMRKPSVMKYLYERSE
jgi:hypothetical protein